jgi:hypothetical protein
MGKLPDINPQALANYQEFSGLVTIPSADPIKRGRTDILQLITRTNHDGESEVIKPIVTETTLDSSN